MGTTAMNTVRAPWNWRRTLQSLIRAIPRKPAVAMSVEKSVAVGQKATATLLSVNGERLLLGVTGGSISVLRRWQHDGAIEVRGEVR